MLSPIVSGTSRMASWGWDVSARVRWIERCLALGVSSFDHADIYGGYSVEALFGEALAAVPELRERIQIVTKCGIKLVSPVRPGHAIKRYDSARAQVTASVEASLSALRTDRIDVLLIHRPDALMDPDELADAFDALLHRRHPLVTHQIEFSPLQLQALGDGTLDQCVDLCLRPMIWSALAGGRLFSGDGAQALRVRGRSMRWPRPMASVRPPRPMPGSCATRHGRCPSPARRASRPLPPPWRPCRCA